MATVTTSADQKQIAAPEDASNTSDKKAKETSRKESLSGAAARAAFGSLAFLFRLPIRLFRPVKLSSWTVLESIAKRENKQLSMRYVWTLFRRENKGFILHLLGPPILANTLIGFCLFEGYSFAESRLLRLYRPNQVQDSSPKRGDKEKWTPLWIVAFSGGFAGAAQCLISAPLDNVRLVLSSQQHKSRQRPGSAKKHSTTISWRSIIRAAVLPFAPSTNQHRKLVKAMNTGTAEKSSKPLGQEAGSSQARRFLNTEQRKMIQRTLKNVSGGVHGAGLLMSLARDSVGFASFFFIFEVSRRIAHGTSMATDHVIAWFNASSTLPPGRSGPDIDQDGSGTYKTAAIDADFSYNASRTKTGRVIAAFVLIVGGGLGALCYELVGRPFELMRVVIWTGRRKWQAETNRQKRTTAGARSLRHLKANGHVVAAQAPNVAASRLESLVTLRAANSAGSRLSRMQALLGQSHPPHPLRLLTGQRKPRVAAEGVAAKAPSHETTRETPHWARKAPPRAPARPPSAISLLIEHAERTSTLAYTSSSQKFRTAVPNSVLLVHTYFIAPYLASLTTDDGRVKLKGFMAKDISSSPSRRGSVSSTARSAASLLSKWTNKNPVSTSINIPSKVFKRHGRGISAGSHAGLSYLPPRPQGAPGSIATSSLAQRWGSGRVAWALKRLASPYAVGFFAFAIMSGEV